MVLQLGQTLWLGVKVSIQDFDSWDRGSNPLVTANMPEVQGIG